jgi:RimK family alpha-L-glutamate ligase
MLLLLTARLEVAANRRLGDAATGAGVTLRVVDANRVGAMAGSKPRLWLDGEDLLEQDPSAVLARVGNWRPDSVLAALETAIAAGVPTPNPPASIRLGRDHWLTVRHLAAAGVAAPESVAGADPEALARVAVEALGLPVVVKQRRSRMGVGVIRCATRDHLEAVLDSLWRVGDEVMVQRLVDSGGTSLRLVVVGGRVVAAARFVAAADEWRSNAARGGQALPHRVDGLEESLAIAAAAALGLGICGVDILPTPDGPVVVEVNPSPGFRHVEAASGVDVAREIVAELVRCASRREGT